MTGQQTIELVGSLAKTFLLHRMTAREELGRLFELTLDCLSKDFDVRPTKNPSTDGPSFDVLGQTMTVRVELPRGGWRYFDGHVCRFECLGVTASRRYARYRMVLRPWLWFLTRSADCRIFQDRAVPDILKEVFREHGFSDFQEALYGEYRRREYCVQYRETDFDFVSRLMEHAGIYYYFRHEYAEGRGRHTLVLADDYSAHVRAPGYEAVGFQRVTKARADEPESVGSWRTAHEVEPDVYELGDFDFTKRKAGLLVNRHAAPEIQPARGKVFDYPGTHRTLEEGEAQGCVRMEELQAQARLRMEELQAQHERVYATTTARGLAVGNLFELREHPRADQNREYLVVSTVQTLRSVAYETELDPEARTSPLYAGEFTAMPSGLPFRSPRTTPNPVVQGPQTAIVVGPAKEKVWTDEYGRVKVRFHWDHRNEDASGKSIPDDSRSCWLRVSQNWAGQQWGELYLPHVGQEVVVSFLEGDPDRPLVTGRVYNAAHMPPLDLPKEKYKSVVARDDYGNELVFDGTPDDEHILLYSPKNRSGLRLGPDFDSRTDAKKDFVTRDSSAGLNLGNKCELSMGATFEGSLGWNAEASFATSFEVAVGPSFSLSWGPKYEKSWAQVDESKNEDWIVDCAKTICLVSGKGGQNSVFSATQGRTEISVGDEVHAITDQPLWKMLLLAFLSLAGTATSVGFAEGKKFKKDGKTTPLGVGLASGLGVLFGIYPWIDSIIGQIKSSSEPKTHQKKSAWLTLSDAGVGSAGHSSAKAILDAENFVGVGMQKAKMLTLGNTGADVTISGSKIKLNATGNDVTINGSKIMLG